MSEMIAAAVEWLSSTGAPNWLVLLGWFTAPATWSDAVRERVRPVVDLIIPKSAPTAEAGSQPTDEGGG